MAATLAVEHRRRLAGILFITIVAVVFGMAIALFLLTLI